jgi:hypothetical protein
VHTLISNHIYNGLSAQMNGTDSDPPTDPSAADSSLSGNFIFSFSFIIRIFNFKMHFLIF